jgi:ferredoxin--NADP+ reductase
MAFAITQTCCNDASCVSVCPVNCIHPTPDEPDFGKTDMLYVDPQVCIDCGACADACPVDAIFPVDRLSTSDTVYAEINKEYYDEHPAVESAWGRPEFPRSVPQHSAALRFAVIGTGPAACYTAQLLLRRTEAEVTMIERLPVPGGLIRFGVAPDHQSTKKIGDSFAWMYDHPRLRMFLNLEVGGENADITHEELAAHHHAVIYAVGAAGDKTLGIPGEQLSGSVHATSFVGWYNAHPGVPAASVDVRGGRAVVVGNGNVALDVARMLLSDPNQLATTDIAEHALRALRANDVREVVLLGRRGPEHAAYTRSEFLALQGMPGVDMVVDENPVARESIAEAAPKSKEALLRDIPMKAVDWSSEPAAGNRIVLRFHCTPTELLGDDKVESVRVTDLDAPIATGLVVRCIGYRGAAVDGLPFDETTATVPNDGGRVTARDGSYVVGWIKRGPSGGIGTNRACASETVETLLEDAAANRLSTPAWSAKDFARLVRRRQPNALGRKEMLAIDTAERRHGAENGRPRVKLATVPELLAVTRRRRATRT